MTGKAESARPAGHELLITRSFDAPVSLVFRIWAQREHMIRWWGPQGFTCTSLALDFRPGGAWRACIESAAYGKSWMGGKFRGRTIQSFHQAPFIHVEGRDSHIEGWNSAVDKQQAYTQRLYRGPS